MHKPILRHGILQNTVTNHIELFSEKEYVKQFGAVDETTEFYRSIRNGLVELDLVAYSTHLKLAVNMPKLGAQKNIISSPEVAGVAFTEADEVTGVALGLKGQVNIDKQPGIALANILSGVVGDLETKLVIEEDIDIRFAIEAAVGIKYSLKDKNFALNAVDLRISLTRVDATLGNVPLAVLTYISSEGTLYVDVSHFFQKQNAGNNKNLGMLKITGVNVLDLINGLITGEGSATSVALGSSDAWVEDEQQPYTYVYYEANAINSAAPAKFVHVAQLNEKTSREWFTETTSVLFPPTIRRKAAKTCTYATAQTRIRATRCSARKTQKSSATKRNTRTNRR